MKQVINLERKRLSNLPFSEKLKNIILGSSLGSLFLKQNTINLKHSEKKLDWFKWKTKIISEEIKGKILRKKNKKTNLVNYYFISTKNFNLDTIEKVINKNQRFKLKRSLLNHFSDETIMIWWLDKGYLLDNGTKGYIKTEHLSLTEQKILVKYFFVVHKIQMKIIKFEKSEQYRILIDSSESLEKLFKKIVVHIPIFSLLYKVKLQYKDVYSQQRWISFLYKFSNFNKKQIDDLYSEENDIVQS